MTEPTPRYQQILFDILKFVKKENGDFNSIETVYRGQLGTYRMRVSTSITDEGTVYQFFQNGKMMINLFPTKSQKTFVGKDESGDYFVFKFEGVDVNIFKRHYNL